MLRRQRRSQPRETQRGYDEGIQSVEQVVAHLSFPGMIGTIAAVNGS